MLVVYHCLRFVVKRAQLSSNMPSWRDEYLDEPRDATRGECVVTDGA
jgi:hypothetical protein